MSLLKLLGDIDPRNLLLRIESIRYLVLVFPLLPATAMTFDRRLRRGVNADEAATLEEVLSRLAANVADDEDGAPPCVGLIEQGT